MAPKLRLMIVAGEPSGDAHAAALVRELRDAGRELDIFGATGPLMRAEGVESIVNTDELSILGLLEIGRALPKFLQAYKQLKRAAVTKQTDAVILIDWPDFNLRLARALHRRGIKVIYYICPQLWAWRAHRLASIKRDVDMLLTILPFEREWYAARGIEHVEFVGHPLAGEVNARFGRAEFCRRHQLDPARPLVSLLPGSRRKELDRILPTLIEAAALVKRNRPEAQFVLVVAPSRSLEEAQAIVSNSAVPDDLKEFLRIVHHETREALAASDSAAVASGTATLEATLLNTPMVVVYKESAINWHTLGRLITAEHYSLVNLIAGKQVAIELIQNELTADRVAAELMELLEPERNAQVRAQLKEVVEKLGRGGASRQAAQLILAALEESPGSLEPNLQG